MWRGSIGCGRARNVTGVTARRCQPLTSNVTLRGGDGGGRAAAAAGSSACGVGRRCRIHSPGAGMFHSAPVPKVSLIPLEVTALGPSRTRLLPCPAACLGLGSCPCVGIGIPPVPHPPMTARAPCPRCPPWLWGLGTSGDPSDAVGSRYRVTRAGSSQAPRGDGDLTWIPATPPSFTCSHLPGRRVAPCGVGASCTHRCWGGEVVKDSLGRAKRVRAAPLRCGCQAPSCHPREVPSAGVGHSPATAVQGCGGALVSPAEEPPQHPDAEPPMKYSGHLVRFLCRR